jgi:HSP20 family protein
MSKRSLIPMDFGQNINPFRDLSYNLKRLERLFNDVWRGEPLVSLAKEETLWPTIDVIENDKSIQIIAELPGLEEKDINIEMRNGVFSLRGEKQEQREENRDNYHVSERSHGYFSRSFQIPTEIDEDKIEATLKDGVLKVVLPKSDEESQQKKRIEIIRQ